jgi:nitrogenase molybdenum-iron protein alpha/beta subunit
MADDVAAQRAAIIGWARFGIDRTRHFLTQLEAAQGDQFPNDQALREHFESVIAEYQAVLDLMLQEAHPEQRR